MTYKEALEWCEMFEDNVIFNGTCGKREGLALQAMRECRKALLKQIPKKPRENRYPWVICPKCGGSVYLRNAQEHIQNGEVTYCEHCGQALDWSDTE